MRKGENFNHPKKGSTVKVEPIQERKDIETIKRILADRPRDLCLFILGVNTALRASDLVRVEAGMVRHLKPGDSFEIREKKTGRLRRITVGKAVVEAVQRLLASRPYEDSDLLFQGKRGPISAIAVNVLVKKWTRAVNLKGRYGGHTLRKTWGYHQRKSFGVSLPVLMECFGHSSQGITLRYLCLQPEEVEAVYKNELIGKPSLT